METTHEFPDKKNALSHFTAIQGKVYHRMHPLHANSIIRWILYDGFLSNIPHKDLASDIPSAWIDTM